MMIHLNCTTWRFIVNKYKGSYECVPALLQSCHHGLHGVIGQANLFSTSGVLVHWMATSPTALHQHITVSSPLPAWLLSQSHRLGISMILAWISSRKIPWTGCWLYGRNPVTFCPMTLPGAVVRLPTSWWLPSTHRLPIVSCMTNCRSFSLLRVTRAIDTVCSHSLA